MTLLNPECFDDATGPQIEAVDLPALVPSKRWGAGTAVEGGVAVEGGEGMGS